MQQEKFDELKGLILSEPIPSADVNTLMHDVLVGSTVHVDGWSLADLLYQLRRTKETWKTHAENAADSHERAYWLERCATLGSVIAHAEQKHV